MRHIRAVNRKARRIEEHVASVEGDSVALQQGPGAKPHIPMGCSLVFNPGSGS